MKKYLFVSMIAAAALTLAGCSAGQTTTLPQDDINPVDQQQVEEISQSSSDSDAAQAALDATDQAINELDSIDFGEAPAVE